MTGCLAGGVRTTGCPAGGATTPDSSAGETSDNGQQRGQLPSRVACPTLTVGEVGGVSSILEMDS
jgi:hypothetical protein